MDRPVTINPLVVPRIDAPTDIWAGVWIAEDIELIVQGVRTGSWVDTSIGTISAGLDGLAFVADPFSGLLQYFAASLMEHFGPLRDALDWLAGDPGPDRWTRLHLAQRLGQLDHPT